MRDQHACATGQIAPFMQNPQTTAFVILTPQIMVEVLKESGFNSSVGMQIGLGVCVYINSTSKVGTYLITSHFNISGRGTVCINIPQSVRLVVRSGLVGL